MPEQLTKKETAELLGISVRQVQRLMAAGKLSYQMGYTPRGDVALFDRQEVEHFREAKEQQLYVPAHPRTPDISSQTRASHGVSLARSADIEAIARTGLEALQASALEISRQMAEAMQKASAEIVEQFRSVKFDPTLLELAAKAWLTRREAIRLSGLPAKVVNEGLKNRRLGAKCGRRWIIRRTDLDRFAAAWKPRNGTRRKN